MMKHLLNSITILSWLCISNAWSQNGISYGIQSSVMVQMDSSMNAGGAMGSISKLSFRYSRQFDLMKSYISANSSGVLFYDNIQNKMEIIPEWDIKSGLKLYKPFSVRLFSKYTPFSPYNYFSKGNINIESETGLELTYQVNPSNSLSFVRGMRHIDLSGNGIDNYFNSLRFQRQSQKSSLRISTDFIEQNENPYQKFSLHHWKQFGRGRISLSALTHNQSEYQYSTITLFGFVPLGQKHKLNVNYVLNDYTIQSNHQFNQFYQLQYLYYLKNSFRLETKIEGDWVRNANSNISLWRSYLSGIGLNLSKNQFKIDNGTYIGYREDFQYGKGISFNQETRFSFHPKKIYFAQIQLNDFVRGIYFLGATEEDSQALFELDNELRMDVKIWPENSIYPGFRSVLNTHIGDGLTYEQDSLENTILNTLYLTYREITNWVEIGFSLKEKIHPEKVKENIYSVNYRLKLPWNFKVNGLIRFNSDTYLTLRTTYRLNLGQNQIQLDLNHFGNNSDLWKDQTQVLIGFRRGL